MSDSRQLVREAVREQYERFPYPPAPLFKLPTLSQDVSRLSFARATLQCQGHERSDAGIRILVAGCGTLEPLLVAQANPRARELVAVDWSFRSIEWLKKRWRLSRALRPRSWIRSGVQLSHLCADLWDWTAGGGTGEFDLILVSNVLHHTPDPGALLGRLARLLKPDGLMRVVTYPRQSRIWMRQVSRWFALHGMAPGSPALRAQAALAMQELPAQHPIRGAFRSQPEIVTQTGLVDAFFNACENPLTPWEWSRAAESAGLDLRWEDQKKDSSSRFLDEIAPELTGLSPMAKLQVMDDLLELTSNPVWWFARTEARESKAPLLPGIETYGSDTGPDVQHSRVRAELALGLLRVAAVAESAGLNARFVETLWERLRTEVGPRVMKNGSALPGMSIGEYDFGEIGPESEHRWPWDAPRWTMWEAGRSIKLEAEGVGALVGRSAAQQAEWLQLVYGPRRGKFRIVGR